MANARIIAVVSVAACAIGAAVATDGIARFVDNGVIISIQRPAIAIAVDDAFTYVGRHPVHIRDVAAGERFMFVDADHNRVERLLIVQFEGFLPGVDKQYRYDLSKSPVVAGYPFRSNGFAFNMANAIATNPGDEAAGTHAFLLEQGYTAPADWMMWRSLTVDGEARRDEMIIFYVEGADSKGLTLDDLYQDNAETAAWRNIQQALEIRANQSFQLAPLNHLGRPETAGWASLPNRFVP